MLDHSLDVGAVRKRMAGPTMAQRQFYFVDACRVRLKAIQFRRSATASGSPRCSRKSHRVTCLLRGHPEHGGARRGRRRDALRAGAARCLDTALGVDDHVQEDGSWAVTTTTR